MSSTLSPTITVTTITPEIASDLLARNVGNRPPSKAHVDRLANAMRKGTYRLTGDPIRLGRDGRLYDGQHRLLACVASATAFQTVLVTDLEAETLLVIDSGKTRSTADQLHIASNIDKDTVATAQMLLRLGIGHKPYMEVSTDELQRIISRHPIIGQTADAYKDAGKFQLGGNIPAGELVLRAHGYQLEADAWRAVWRDGEKHPLALSAHAFRERLIADPEKPRAQRINAAKRRVFLGTMIFRTMTNTPPATLQMAKVIYSFPRVNVENLLGDLDFSTTVKPPMAQTVSNSTSAGRSKRKRKTAPLFDGLGDTSE